METNTLYTKLAKIMGEVSRIPKNGVNKFHNYKYATEGDISDAIRTLLSQHNIAIFASMVEHEQREIPTQKGTTLKTICTFEFTLACGDTGATHVCRWAGEADDGQDKGYNKASTAAMKYWLLKTFMIPTGDDPDGDQPDPKANKGASANPKQRAPQQPAQPVGNPTPATPPAVIGNPDVDYGALEAEERRKAVQALDNEYVTIRKVRYTPTQNGLGVPCWTATADIEGGGTIPVIVFGEDAAKITKAGYTWPKTDGDKLSIRVITELRGSDRRITHVEPKETLETPPDAIPAWFSTEVGKCWSVLKQYLLSEKIYGNEFEMKASFAKRGVLTQGSLSDAWKTKPASDLVAFAKARHEQPEGIAS